MLVAAIEGLPGDARQTFLLREVDGLAYAEIAQVMDVPKGTVMSRLHYARKRLRQSLLDAGASAADPGAGEQATGRSGAQSGAQSGVELDGKADGKADEPSPGPTGRGREVEA